MDVYEYTTNLSYNHVGVNNVLSYSGLTELLQEAATLHADSLGWGISSVPKTNLTWILLYWKIKIFSTPKWNTKVTVKTWPREMARIYSYRDFEVYDDLGNLIAVATSKWVLINVKTHSITRITPEITNSFNITKKLVFPDFKEPSLKLLEDSILTFEYKIGRRDIDSNHHVNNLCYLDFALESLPEDAYSNNFTDIEILYKKEIKLGSLIKCFYSKNNDEHIISIKSEDLSTLHAIIKLK